MAALLDFDFGDEEAEVSASDSDSEASSEDEDEEEDEEDSDSSTRKASKKKPKAVPKKAGKKAKAKPVARVKKDKTKKKKKDKGRTLKADRSSVTRQSNKGDDQLMRFKNWRSVAECHIKDFLTSAEPVTCNREALTKLDSRSLKRLFFGYFGVRPGAKVERKSKGKMRRDLMTEYHNLGFPGRNRTMWEVIHQVEDKMSKNMDFIVGTSESGRQYVATKKASAWLPLLPKGKWAKDVLVDEMGIPIISDASGMKHKCISFFRGGEGGGSVEASSSALPVARAEVPALQASPPLPGMTANPGGLVPYCGPPSEPPPPAQQPQALPESDSDDDAKAPTEPEEDDEDMIQGYFIKQVPGTVRFEVRQQGDASGKLLRAALPEGCVDWALDVVKDKAHKRCGEVFAFSPGKQSKSVWMTKLTWDEVAGTGPADGPAKTPQTEKGQQPPTEGQAQPVPRKETEDDRRRRIEDEVRQEILAEKRLQQEKADQEARAQEEARKKEEAERLRQEEERVRQAQRKEIEDKMRAAIRAEILKEEADKKRQEQHEGKKAEQADAETPAAAPEQPVKEEGGKKGQEPEAAVHEQLSKEEAEKKKQEHEAAEQAKREEADAAAAAEEEARKKQEDREQENRMRIEARSKLLAEEEMIQPGGGDKPGTAEVKATTGPGQERGTEATISKEDEKKQIHEKIAQKREEALKKKQDKKRAHEDDNLSTTAASDTASTNTSTARAAKQKKMPP